MVYWKIVGKQKYSDSRRNTCFTDIPGVLLTAEKWSKFHVHINKITECTKLHFFQYKLLNRYVITNVRRNKFNVTISPLCSFCKNTPETIKHLFYDCILVKKFIYTLRHWLKFIVKIELPEDFTTIILNNSTGPDHALVDTLLLLMKQFIYAQKCLDNPLTVQRFIVHVVKYKNIEQIAAV